MPLFIEREGGKEIERERERQRVSVCIQGQEIWLLNS